MASLCDEGNEMLHWVKPFQMISKLIFCKLNWSYVAERIPWDKRNKMMIIT